MKTKATILRTILISLGISLIVAAAGSRAPAADPTLVVVVAASSPLTDISKSALRRAFLGEPTEVGGKRLVPLNQEPGSPARVTFDKELLQLAPDAMVRFWIDQRIRGQPAAPRSISSVPLLIRVVSQLPGAIAYVRENEVPPSGMKILTIEGKRPGAAGYPLP